VSISLTKSWRSPSRSPAELATRLILWLCTSISIVTTVGIIFVLCQEAFGFFQKVSVFEFFTDTQWTPLIEPRRFGILPLITGTLLIGVGASLAAVPIGAISALYLSEYVQGAWKIILKSTLEILAGIPTVVYGFFAVTFITPQLQKVIPDLEIFNALSAALVVGMMVIPTISSISQDAFEAVPRDLREAAYGLGARKYQVTTTVVFPAGLSGFVASVILAFSRAIGETMAVTLAAGSTPKLTLNPLESIQTMTAYIVQVSLGDSPAGGIEYQSIFAVGLVLFCMTLATNLIAQMIVKRFQEKYH
jgi:phosphate transport system permease protein